jgi:hypothetical protein
MKVLDQIPLSGGDYNGAAVKGGQYELVAGDLFRIVGHPDPAIRENIYVMFDNGVARHTMNLSGKPIMEEFHYSQIGDRDS